MIPNRLRRSFSARLSFFILLFTAAIFLVAFWVFYHLAVPIIERDAQINSENILQNINLQIEKVLRRVEAVPDNLNWIITGGSILPDSMYNITRNVVLNNPDIYGSAIAFEPNYFKEKGYYFSPYSCRDGDTIRSLQLGNEEYDYFTWEWYSKPKNLGHPCWSEPYYDEGGGQMIMCTYSAPVYDRNGEFIGIFTSDISLEWLTDMLDSMRRSDESYTFMLGKDGTYIAHFKRERILHKTIFEVSEEMTNPQVKLLGENMIAGKQGMHIVNNDGLKTFVFYASVPHTQWSLGIVIPEKEVFSDLSRINLMLLLTIGLGLIALFLIASQTISKLTKPLKIFAVSAREIAHGDFSAKLPIIRSSDEMKELYDSFTYMQSELTDYITNLQQTTSAKEKIESELRIARDIQMGMIPKIFPPFPTRKEIDLYAVLNPAKTVGGDLYDFFIEDNNLYFTIGDVSGKGVPASLLMAVTLSLFRSVSESTESPGEIMNSLNASISENNDSNMFITLFIGILNLKTGVLNYCNAGHNPPVVVAPDGECAWMKLIPNIPVGVIKGFLYREQCLKLSDSSAIILYTDGVTEAENAEKDFYGGKRFFDIIRRNPKSSPRSMIETLLSDINQHVKDNEPSDDITLLAIEYDRCKDLACNVSKLIISNKIEELSKLGEFVEKLCENFNLSPELVMNINLALEEAVSNVILYAYKDRHETEQIEIVAQHSDNKLIFTLADNGTPFDPTLNTDPDLTLSIEERPVGGLGIFLIKKIMDKVEYRRENGKNILSMSKNY